MKNKLRTLMMVALVIAGFTGGAVPARAVEPVSDTTAQLSAQAPDAADNRAGQLRAFLASFDSPLTGDAEAFVSEADKNNLDWKLVAAIAGVESTFGKQIPKGSFNAWGWGVFTGAQDGVHFSGWADGIAQVSKGLRDNYIDRGASDIYEIGWIYAANGNSWGNHVQYFLDKIAAFTPADPDYLDITI